MLTRLLRRMVDVRDEEVAALLWSFAYFFFLLSSYYVLRPIRDEMGVAGGVDRLQWMFTGTFLAMLAAVPAFGWAVARFPRARLVPVVYRAFVACLIVFFVLMTAGIAPVAAARAFFIWVSLYNLFVVSVFWSFMADLFRNEQGRRLFGFIAAGGTVGALVGPSLTAVFAVPLGPVNLLLVSALFLELAVQCVRRLLVSAPGGGRTRVAGSKDRRSDRRVIGGGILAGITETLRSPYLLGIGAYIVLYTGTSTFLYFAQLHIVADAFASGGERTRIFAAIDLAVGLATILMQAFATGRFIARFGVGWAAALLPGVTAAGFGALAALPAVGLVIAFQAVRRAVNFAISRPAREVLFTVVTPEQKYKSKNVIDTVVYRGGDAASGWTWAGLSGLGLGLPEIAALTVPVALVWAGLALALGRRQNRLAGAEAGQSAWRTP